jgi:hypothetical protein
MVQVTDVPALILFKIGVRVHFSVRNNAPLFYNALYGLFELKWTQSATNNQLSHNPCDQVPTPIMGIYPGSTAIAPTFSKREEAMLIHSLGPFDNAAEDYQHIEARSPAAAMGAEICGVKFPDVTAEQFVEIEHALFRHEMIVSVALTAGFPCRLFAS